MKIPILDTFFLSVSVTSLFNNIESTLNILMIAIALISGVLSAVLKYRQVQKAKTSFNDVNCPFKHQCSVKHVFSEKNHDKSLGDINIKHI